MITEYDNSKHNTPVKIQSRKKLIEMINALAPDYNRYWTLCNRIVGTPNEFTQIIEGTHFKPQQFFGADYDIQNIEHNRSLNLGAHFFDGDFRVAFFRNTSKTDRCVVNLDMTGFPDNTVGYVETFISMCKNRGYFPPIIFVNSTIDHRGNTADKKRFVDMFNSPGWMVDNFYEYRNVKSTMQYNIILSST